MRNLGFNFEVMPSDFDENIDTQIPPAEYVTLLSAGKAEDIAGKIRKDAIIIAADTIVVLGAEIINKPADEQQAFDMLKKLSGITHEVYTGITLVNTAGSSEISDYQRTEVTFRELKDDEVWAYIKSGSPMDKAGAYGIQDDFGAVFVSRIEGCYYNIVGLPLELLYRKLKELINV